MSVIITILIIVLIGLFIGAFVSGLNKPENKKIGRSLNERLIDKTHSCNYPKKGYKRVKVESFQEKHRLMPIELFNELLEWDHDDIIYIEPAMYRSVLTETADREHGTWALTTYSDLIGNARVSERDNDLQKSIALYENALEFAKKNALRIHNFAHCIDRLLILYRKAKNKECEIKLLQYALETHTDFNNSTYDKWNERLTKLI